MRKTPAGQRRKKMAAKPNKNEGSPRDGDTDRPTASFPEFSPFKWDEQRSQAAIGLASGKTHEEVAAEVACTRRTLTNWLQHIDFSSEVDRLSVMVDVASRAQRLRLANRVVRQKTAGNKVETEKDLLEWLKFAQSETDGIKLDLTKLAALGEDDAPMAVSRSDGAADAGETESVN